MTSEQRCRKVAELILGSCVAIGLVALFNGGEAALPASLPMTDDEVNITLHIGASSLVSNEKFFTNIIHPEKLQPYWLMAFAGPGVVLMTIVVFGFDFRTKEKEDKKNAVYYLTLVVKTGANLMILAMALNCLRQDFTRWSEVPAHGFVSSICAGGVLLATSSNFKAALAIWMKIKNHNPGALFNKEPTYSSIPKLNFPLSPFETSWMPPFKWLYAVVLLPYYFPLLLVQGLSTFLMCWTKGCIWCAICGKFFGFCCWTFLVIISLGLWAYARESLGADWQVVWPLVSGSFRIGLLQVGAYFVALAGSAIYGIYLASVSVDDSAERHDLWDIQPSGVKNDFREPTGASDSLLGDQTPNALSPSKALTPNLMKTAVVLGLLVNQAYVVISQFFVISVCRVILVGEGIPGITTAIQDTLTERSISAYIEYLRSTANGGLQKFQTFWNAL